MAVLGRPLFSSSERVDLNDLQAIDSYVIGDFKYLLRSLVGNDRPYVLKGFEVINPNSAVGAQNLSINVADSVVFYPGSSAGPFFFGLPEGNDLSEPLIPELKKNATNYVYLILDTLDTATDARALLDPDIEEEFTQDINTESVLIVDVGVSVSAFPDNTIPVCIATVGPTTIQSIKDARDLMFRLGSGGIAPNPLNRFSFRSLPSSTYQRLETPITINSGSGVNPFQGADKNIYTLKEWMDAVMTRIAELSGTTFWYEGSSAPSTASIFNDALATSIKSKGQWQHDSSTAGLLTWTEDIQLKSIISPVDVLIRNGNKTLTNEQVMYLPLVRNEQLNAFSQAVDWINGVNYVNGAVGAFTNLAKGDWIKSIADSDEKYLRVEEFYTSTNLGGGTTSSTLAQSVQLSSTYAGITAPSIGLYVKGVYQAADVLIANRTSNALVAAGSDLHWMAIRSDVIQNISSVATLSFVGSVSAGDGFRAKFVSVAHGLVDGDRINVHSSVNYNGTYVVQVEDADTFYIETVVVISEGGVSARYALVTTTTRSSTGGTQLESANHNFKDNDTIAIAGTTNYNGTFPINVRSVTTFTYANPVTAATELTGTATLSRIDVRSDSGIDRIVMGESVDIGSLPVNLNTWLGRNSDAETYPYYVAPSSYNALYGSENFNALSQDNLATRVAKLTMMMADKAQDKTVTMLPTNLQKVNNVVNGANQDISFTSTLGTQTLTVTMPSSAGGTITLGGTLSLPANSVAYFVADRNTSFSAASLAGLTVSAITDVPTKENLFIFAYRLTGNRVWLWNGLEISESLYYYYLDRMVLGDLVEDRTAYLRSDDLVTWSGTQLSFTADIILEILTTRSGTLSQHAVDTTDSPISIANGESIWVEIDRTVASETLTIFNSGGTPIPAQTQADKDIFVLFRRVDVGGNAYLHIPLHKQVILTGQSIRLGSSPGNVGAGSGVGDDLNSLTFRASIQDLFDSPPAADLTSTVNVSVGFTDASQHDATNKYFRLSYDASKTATGTGTSMVLSAAPAFTVKVGDVLVVAAQAKRITVLGSINTDGGAGTPFTIESAFVTDPAAAAANVSQTVYTKDLNNLAADGEAIATVLTDSVDAVLVTYEDTSTLADVFPDLTVTPHFAYTLSSDNVSFTTVKVRPTTFTTELSVVNVPTPSTGLYIRFFANKTAGSGAVNLLGYKAFLHQEEVVDQGPIFDAAYCFTDGVGTEYNCQPPTVFGGNTRIQLDWTYSIGQNLGGPAGSIDVYLNGQLIPRFIDGTLTPDASYTEVNSFTIDLDDDYSTFNYNVEIVKRVALVDESESNTLQLQSFQDAVVGNTAQVASGVATHTTLGAAITATTTGGSILVLDVTTVESGPITLTKKLFIRGKGHSSVITGATFTFDAGSDFSLIKWLKFGENITINATRTGIFFTENWLATTKTLTDNGTGNYLVYITE